jgi:alpha-beta hydrolase superfamily lysophospholipase
MPNNLNMKINTLQFLLFISLTTIISCITNNNRKPQSESSFHVDLINYNTNVTNVNEVNLRTGIFYESTDAQFKGCILYLQGLADSILNHRPLFKVLSENGYRVISFDYMGQGGSQGAMNDTRLLAPLFQGLEIGHQAKYIWNIYSNLNGVNGLNCSQSKKMIIGWSTGGLAGYKLAYEKWADSVVLIAPGIHPKYFVGESAKSKKSMLTTNQIITERTLTNNKFEGQINPHIDPIKPTSPLAVPLFAANLIQTSKVSHFWKIPQQINGLVFLSGKNDSYVDLAPTQQTLSKMAPHFSVISYSTALHEIDNEIPEIADDMILKTVQFFDQQIQNLTDSKHK